MRRCIQLLIVSAFFGAAALIPSDQGLNAAPPPSKPTSKPPAKPAKPTKPHVKPHPPSKKTFKVQARAPHWRNVAAVPSHSAATAIKRRLNHQGWQAKIRHTRRGGSYVVSARMVHWHTRAVVRNPAQAHRLAQMLMAQGFQARIV